MTIEKMYEWLKRVEPGEDACATRDSLELCMTDPEIREHLEPLAWCLRGTEQEAFLLALGHYIAVSAIDIIMTEMAARRARGAKD